MNAVELYKKLPQKNCGKCSLKTCMPFALAVIKGDAELDECPLMTGDTIADIKGAITRTDWREELILKLREEIKGTNFKKVAEGIGAVIDNGSLVLECFGRQFRISPDGEITVQGRMTPWIKILLLHYVRTAGKGGLTGRYASYSELKGGMVKALSFQRECEIPLTELFERDPEKTARLLSRMGTKKPKDFPTEHAWQLYLLPMLPVFILYWPAEEEFPARVKIFFDSSADRYLDAESLIFLVEGLVKNIEMSPH
ncbi:MAG TPA: DUF3786 domain-containing protein [Candidatus Sulfobium mesophilum]|nr:DUF3786 domain-containing protein [Candidatus Sulfobium mesophilum]